jgi:hypothetical protein
VRGARDPRVGAGSHRSSLYVKPEACELADASNFDHDQSSYGCGADAACDGHGHPGGRRLHGGGSSVCCAVPYCTSSGSAPSTSDSPCGYGAFPGRADRDSAVGAATATVAFCASGAVGGFRNRAGARRGGRSPDGACRDDSGRAAASRGSFGSWPRGSACGGSRGACCHRSGRCGGISRAEGRCPGACRRDCGPNGAHRRDSCCGAAFSRDSGRD